MTGRVTSRAARGGTLVLGGGFAGGYVARLLGRPVVVLGAGPRVEGEGVERVETPEEAVRLALGLVDAP